MNIQLIQARLRQAQVARLQAMIKSPAIPTAYTEVEMQEHLCLVAFKSGSAGPEHWNSLAECRNVLMWGAAHKREEARRDGTDASDYQAIVDLCLRVKTAMLDVAKREQKTGRLGLNAEQLELIAACVMTSADFWPQQPAWLFRECVAAVRRLNPHTITPSKQKRHAAG